ncbi:hypothetical protein RZ532_01495 [Nitratireductor aquimarinus]|uniref:hypothetical protein n=1 Tax=Nitratireductor aquimarinus TaxID=889300 RepID=UPI002935D636|nr:hypothetical protein [Nitratireductor aquimarinus]MDV2964634.1 hypothetical protein [Nitratireductor aquimarinus]
MAEFDEAALTWRLFLVTSGICLVLLAIGWVTCERAEEKPLLAVLGGGFKIDHNSSEIHYDLAVREIRHLRHGMIIEADFEDPAGNGYYVVRERVQRWRKRYSLRSPPVCGVRARKRYLVMLRVLNDQGEEELWSDIIYVSSHLGEDVMPEPPLTTWPGRDLSLHAR